MNEHPKKPWTTPTVQLIATNRISGPNDKTAPSVREGTYISDAGPGAVPGHKLHFQKLSTTFPNFITVKWFVS